MEETDRRKNWTGKGLLAAAVVAVPLVFSRAFGDISMAPSLLAMQIAIVGLLVVLEMRGIPFSLNPLALPAIAFALFSSMSLLYADDPLAGSLELARLLTGLVLFIAVSSLADSRMLFAVSTAAASVGIGIAVLGISQYHGWHPLDIPSAGHPSATFGYRNLAATWLIQATPLATLLAVSSASRRRQWLGAVATALMLVFLVYTRTRGAWVGLAVSGIAVAILLSRRQTSPAGRLRIPTGPAAAAVVLFLALAFLPPSLQRQGPQDIDEQKRHLPAAISSLLTEGADRGRLATWSRTLSMWVDHPLLGVGLGGWAVHYPRYDGGDEVTLHVLPARPHNDWLWILSELGLAGFLLYVWLIAAAVACAIRACRQSENRILASALFASLVAVLTHALFSFPRERPASVFMFWLALGGLSALDPNRRTLLQSGGRQRATRAAMAVAILVMALFTVRMMQFESRVKRATGHEKAQEWEEVAQAAADALDAGRFHHEAVHLRGYALNQLKRFDQSISLYRNALRYRPYDVQMHNGKAIALQGLGQLAKAEQSYRSALAIAPDLEDLHYNLIGLLLEQGDTLRAIAQTDTLLGMSPTTDMMYLVGTMMARAGRPDKARDAYTMCADLSPGFLQAQLAQHRVLAGSYLAQNLPRMALTIYDSLQASEGPSPYLAYLAGEAHIQAEQPLQAIDAYASAVRQKPDFAEAHLALGEAIFKYDMSREDQAIAAYRAFLKLWRGDKRYYDHALNRIVDITGDPP